MFCSQTNACRDDVKNRGEHDRLVEVIFRIVGRSESTINVVEVHAAHEHVSNSVHSTIVQQFANREHVCVVNVVTSIVKALKEI